MYIDLTDPQIESKLLAQEHIYDQLRQSGEEAPATILRFVDTGIRIGDAASMLQFNLMVFPSGGRPSFRADTQSSISDSSRPKFVPDATIYVKFDPHDLTQVAIDHAVVSGPKSNVVTCPNCGATQTLSEGQTACNFCGSALPGG
jgi:hypothetical protein